jgi:hypothetical protein
MKRADRWLIAVGGRGIIDDKMTEKYAEKLRYAKAKWEHAPAVKISYAKFMKLSVQRVVKHWAYKIIYEHLFGGKNVKTGITLF